MQPAVPGFWVSTPCDGPPLVSRSKIAIAFGGVRRHVDVLVVGADHGALHRRTGAVLVRRPAVRTTTVVGRGLRNAPLRPGLLSQDAGAEIAIEDQDAVGVSAR